jgi:hypothetical protein
MAVEGEEVDHYHNREEEIAISKFGACLRLFASECSHTNFCLKTTLRDAAELELVAQ